MRASVCATPQLDRGWSHITSAGRGLLSPAERCPSRRSVIAMFSSSSSSTCRRLRGTNKQFLVSLRKRKYTMKIVILVARVAESKCTCSLEIALWKVKPTIFTFISLVLSAWECSQTRSLSLCLCRRKGEELSDVLWGCQSIFVLSTS